MFGDDPWGARTTQEWEAQVGSQVRDLRRRSGRTQAELAREANVSVSALHALEHGSGSSLGTVIGVVRALGRSEWLDALAPPEAVSPMALLRSGRAAAGRRRIRDRTGPSDQVGDR